MHFDFEDTRLLDIHCREHGSSRFSTRLPPRDLMAPADPTLVQLVLRTALRYNERMAIDRTPNTETGSLDQPILTTASDPILALSPLPFFATTPSATPGAIEASDVNPLDPVILDILLGTHHAREMELPSGTLSDDTSQPWADPIKSGDFGVGNDWIMGGMGFGSSLVRVKLTLG